MFIKGENISFIKLGNILCNDQLSNNKFDYMLSKPPFGVDWKKDRKRRFISRIPFIPFKDKFKEIIFNLTYK